LRIGEQSWHASGFRSLGLCLMASLFSMVRALGTISDLNYKKFREMLILELQVGSSLPSARFSFHMRLSAPWFALIFSFLFLSVVFLTGTRRKRPEGQQAP
jgi:hypothetical protein